MSEPSWRVTSTRPVFLAVCDAMGSSWQSTAHTSPGASRALTGPSNGFSGAVAGSRLTERGGSREVVY